jgi:plasmid stabilization system protein ParE
LDLDIIFNYLSEKSPSAAQRLIQNILDRIGQLESFPDSGAKQATHLNFRYRYLVEGSCKIVYRCEMGENAVFIESVFDTRQSPHALGNKIARE